MTRNGTLLVLVFLVALLSELASDPTLDGFWRFFLMVVLGVPAIAMAGLLAILLLSVAETLGLDSTRRRRARERWLGARKARRPAPSA